MAYSVAYQHTDSNGDTSQQQDKQQEQQEPPMSKENAEQLSHAVGFRNIAVHQYEDIDCKIVLSIITQHLEDFKTFAASIEKLI